MTKESRALITEIYENQLWKKLGTTLMPDALSAIAADSDWPIYKPVNKGFFCVRKEFDSIDDAIRFSDATTELFDIRIKKSLQIGDIEYRVSSNFCGERQILGRTMYWQFDRHTAKALFEWDGYYYRTQCGIKECDFLTWISRNNGKHWDDLLKNGDTDERSDQS